MVINSEWLLPSDLFNPTDPNFQLGSEKGANIPHSTLAADLHTERSPQIRSSKRSTTQTLCHTRLNSDITVVDLGLDLSKRDYRVQVWSQSSQPNLKLGRSITGLTNVWKKVCKGAPCTGARCGKGQVHDRNDPTNRTMKKDSQHNV